MDPPHVPDSKADAGPRPRGPGPGAIGRLGPALAALIVLLVGLGLMVTGPGTPAWLQGARWVLVALGMAIASGLVVMVRACWLRDADRLRSAEQSLHLLSDALVKARRELLEHREAEQELREADRSKDDFLATLCHELRNPLAAIDHAGELLVGEADDEEQRAWAVRVIREQTRQLSRLIDDLLDLSRIAEGTLTLDRRPVPFSEVIRPAVDATRALREGAGLRFDLDLDAAPMWVEVDPARIHQVLINLLSNACRYSDPGGTITIAAAPEGSEAVLRIRDEGIGIEPELLPRIFDMFVRGEAARGRSPTGLGIGLRLAKLIVERHDGAIRADSEGIGRGSVFEIRLPLHAPPDSPTPEAADEDPVGPLRLLIVDDNRPMVEALRMLLRQEGHDIRIARSGRDAIEAASADRPDLILLDLELPDLDGLEVARSIRATAGAASPPIIALTGSVRSADRERLRGAGIPIVLQKPARYDELRRALSRAIREHARSS